MRTLAVAGLVCLGAATQYVPKDITDMLAASDLPGYNNIGALGEAFHNAWRHCHAKTFDWLMDDLQVDTHDPSFDNGYYVEYGIKSRVPRTYEIFQEILGKENYWGTPQFAEDSLAITWGAQPHATQYEETPASYEKNDEQEWITRHNRPVPENTDIALYEGQPLDAIKTYSQGGKTLKELFYNIQQIGYYCDFTLESAQLSFEKMLKDDTAKVVKEERRNTRKQWRFMLKNQIAPLRWNLRMWTRFNIAEPSVHKMKANIAAGWPLVKQEMARLPLTELTASLNMDYGSELSKWEAVHGNWLKDLDKWVASCYPMPEDRTIHTSDKICQHGIDSRTISQNEKDAKKMWREFLRPIIQAYKDSDKFDQQTYDEVYEKVGNLVYNKGKFQSFMLEWKFIRTRVRYFELIPTWELARIHDDIEASWPVVEAFYDKLTMEFDADMEDDLYNWDFFELQKARKDQLKSILSAWINHHDTTYDYGTQRLRKTLRDRTKYCEHIANEIYKWHFQMAWDNMEWKEGRPHDLDSANYKWTPKSRLARQAYWDSRKHYRLHAREFKKLNFHLQRRI